MHAADPRADVAGDHRADHEREEAHRAAEGDRKRDGGQRHGHPLGPGRNGEQGHRRWYQPEQRADLGRGNRAEGQLEQHRHGTGHARRARDEVLARQFAHGRGQAHARQQDDQAGDDHRAHLDRHEVDRHHGCDDGRQQRRDRFERRGDVRSLARAQRGHASDEADHRRGGNPGPAGQQDRGDAGRGDGIGDQRENLGGQRGLQGADCTQLAAAFAEIEIAIDHLVGDFVDQAQALQIDLAGRQAQHLGHLGDAALAVALLRERHDDRGRRRQHVATQRQALADQADRGFKARCRGAVFVQAARQFDDEFDAGGEGYAGHSGKPGRRGALIMEAGRPRVGKLTPAHGRTRGLFNDGPSATQRTSGPGAAGYDNAKPRHG